jgi:hypothetical protein
MQSHSTKSICDNKAEQVTKTESYLDSLLGVEIEIILCTSWLHFPRKSYPICFMFHGSTPYGRLVSEGRVGLTVGRVVLQVAGLLPFSWGLERC